MSRPDFGLFQGLISRLSADTLTDDERAQMVKATVDALAYIEELEQRIERMATVSRVQIGQRFWYKPVDGTREPAVVRAILRIRVKIETPARMRNVSLSSLMPIHDMNEWQRVVQTYRWGRRSLCADDAL